MQRLSSFLLILLFLAQATVSQAQKWDKFAVLMGEKNLNDVIQKKPNNCRVISIRIDGDGNYYPGIEIADKSLKKSDGKLAEWYNDNPAEYAKILETYKVTKTDNSLEELNKAIEQAYVHNIDSLSKLRDIVFLVHGYRKQMYTQKDNSLSMVDNEYVEAELDNDKLFVEIYWDSRHITIVKGAIKKRGLTMMEKSAMPNAVRVGTQLRSLISAIDKKKIAIISHSLGSVVANNIVFNYDSASNLMPNKEIRSAYLAPAIGVESFENYGKRGQSNYVLKVCIGYNENDWVLLKDFEKFGIEIKSDALTYGNTSLGCNFKDETNKLLELFKSTMPNEVPPTLVDMGNRRTHLFAYYARHPSFSKVKAFLFQ